MKYYKQVTTGSVVKREKMPSGKWWKEVTEREYNDYRARVHQLMDNLEKVTAHKARVLGVKA